MNAIKNNQIIYNHIVKLKLMSKQETPRANDTDIFRVRRETRLNQGLFLCKIILKKRGTVQIEGMGECISLVAKLSQILAKNGLATTQKIVSENVERESSKSINPKLTIKLTKSANFDKLTEDIVLKNE